MPFLLSILIVDDHRIFARNPAPLLAGARDWEVVGGAANGKPAPPADS